MYTSLDQPWTVRLLEGQRPKLRALIPQLEEAHPGIRFTEQAALRRIVEVGIAHAVQLRADVEPRTGEPVHCERESCDWSGLDTDCPTSGSCPECNGLYTVTRGERP